MLNNLKKSTKSILQWRRVDKDPNKAEISATLDTMKQMQVEEGIWNL